MQKSTAKIIDMFPQLEKYLPASDSTLLTDEVLNSLPKTQQVFLKMAWFFENPEENNFNLETLYQSLDNDWLEFSLKCINDFFYKDTYLIMKPNYSLLVDGEEFYNQAEFADYLSKNLGTEYSKSKLSIYEKRGSAPGHDLQISQRKFWHKDTVHSFLENELKKINKNN